MPELFIFWKVTVKKMDNICICKFAFWEFSSFSSSFWIEKIYMYNVHKNNYHIF